jgi:cell division protein FtsB
MMMNDESSSISPRKKESGRERGFSSSPVRFNLSSHSQLQKSSNNHEINTSTTNENDYLSLSQQHSLWIGLPSIRNIHPKLYEKIRTLSQDLYKKEIDYQNLSLQFSKVQHDTNLMIKDLSDQLISLTGFITSSSPPLTSSNALSQSFSKESTTTAGVLSSVSFTVSWKQQINELEKQLFHYKELLHIFNQFRSVLKTYPLSSASSSSSSSSSTSTSVDELHDHSLPEYLQSLLLQFSHIATAYHETMESIEIVSKENNELKSLSVSLKQQITSLEKENTELKELTNERNFEFSKSEKEYYSSIEQATELTEKQNFLLNNLQIKIDSLSRDRQITKATIHSLQQREETIKQRLLQSIEKEIPLSSISQELLSFNQHYTLQEIIHYLLEKLLFYVSYYQQHHQQYSLGNNAINKTIQSQQYYQQHHDLEGTNPRQWHSSDHKGSSEDFAMKRSISPPSLTSSSATTVPRDGNRRILSKSTSGLTSSRDDHVDVSRSYPNAAAVGMSNLSSSSTLMNERETKFKPSVSGSSSSSKIIELNTKKLSVPGNSSMTTGSNALQERLKKAQLAFAAMKDSL